MINNLILQAYWMIFKHTNKVSLLIHILTRQALFMSCRSLKDFKQVIKNFKMNRFDILNKFLEIHS